MITLVDSNILIDVFGAHPEHGPASARTLRQCLHAGAVHACEIVWAEVASIFASEKAFLKAIQTLGIEFSSTRQESALLAAHIWRRYRETGGKRERIMADFLIGAHAKIQGDRLLTRDRGFYRHYFSGLTIIEPKINV